MGEHETAVERPLTKNSVEAFAYLRHVLLTGVFSIKYDTNIDKIISSYKHQTSIWAKVSADTRRRVVAEEEARKKIFAKTAKAKATANALEKRGKAQAKAKARGKVAAHANIEPEVFLTPREDSDHRHRSATAIVLLASGNRHLEHPQEPKNLIPYEKKATQKARAKTGEKQNQVSFLISYLVSFLNEYIMFLVLQFLMLFSVFCCACFLTKRQQVRESHVSPATESVGFCHTAESW